MQQNAAMRTRTHFKTHFVSLVSVVQSRCVRPFFASTESQESKSDMNIARQCALRYSILDQCCLSQSLSSLNLSWLDIILKGGGANFSFRDFEPNFLHEFLPKS